jgi:cleavage and polyadenylation specificity factor subunit 1
VPKTAVITPFGLFEYLRTPFGRRNAAQTFQRLMDVVCQDLDFVFVYIDDILVASESKAQHLGHLRTLFERLSTHGLIINAAKCRFGCTELEFLGHHVSTAGAAPLADRVDAIRDFPKPVTVKQLQEFLGLINFYRRFLPAAAGITAPLSQATATKDKTVTWTSDRLAAFNTARKALANAVTLVFPKPEATLALTTDASDIAVGAVLEQHVNGAWQPLAFFSKQLRPPEKKYSAFDRELLAIYLACSHFRHYIEGRQFTVFTDHKPLTFALHRITDSMSARQQRHLAAIAEWTSDIRHIEGKANAAADALSRVVFALGRPAPGIDLAELAHAQAADPDTSAYRTAVTDLRLEDVKLPGSKLTLLCDVSQQRPRPVVPAAFRRRVFDILHGLSHPSVRNTVKLVTRAYVWHGIAKEVREWARSCIACQTSKVHKHTKAPHEEFAVPTRRFQHVNIDLVGPLPEHRGFSYLLTVVDRYTRWPEAIPLPDVRTETVASAFAANWIARYGIPSDISSDRGPQFTSALWAGLAQTFGYTLHHTTAYHPQANGLVERFHRSLKSSLKASCSDAPHEWVDRLPWDLLGLRTAWREDLGSSAAELLYGEPIAVPGTFLPDCVAPQAAPDMLRGLRQQVQQFLPVPTSAHRLITPHVPTDLSTARHVFVRRGGQLGPLQRPYEGPFLVLDKADKFFTLDYGGKLEKFAIDRLKAAHTDRLVKVEVAQPPRRGRPPLAPPTTAPTPAPEVNPEAPSEATPTLDAQEWPPLPLPLQPTTTTRSGRLVVRPNRFAS